MLKKNHIPSEEPIITVGIIMPEDNANSITVKTPPEISDKYIIRINNIDYSLNNNSILNFKLHKKNIEISFDDGIYVTNQEVRINPVFQKKELLPKSGLKVENVISGRDYHWKKRIDVYLPDTLIIKIVKNSLFLYNELPLEHYLMCVATSEMNAACPEALIQSQTIVARSWILAAAEQKHKELGLDACNDDCCQRFQGTTHLTEQSVKGSSETRGLVAVYDNKICDTRYSKSCGGMTESFDTVWEEKTIPYLKVFPDSKTKPKELISPLSDENNLRKWLNSVPDTFCSPHTVKENDLINYLGSVDEDGKYFRWQHFASQKDLTENLNRHHKINALHIKKITASERGGSGRIKYLKVTYINNSGKEKQLILKKDFEIRQATDKSFLYSSAFIIKEKKGTNGIPEGFTFTGAGWGHGVGYCQIGALGMALKGYNTEEIVLHYFPGVELKKIY